ncbi:hypothetical protein C922_01579 [Plasmodium inui San Antonio 1]|uniref:At4g15545-like C-terminal domain-containing protein n=1 Tax=Plasmodium inui San Antonio 1 TaxID=1237626 RepID=W7A3V6_9APIC|nr:hypothetical protein C922_01579 [Plasmodium inui San Antonio 1]EUD67967.1 hypothetical protein C922_01579 [Plasmodium inui San Antonio 1]
MSNTGTTDLSWLPSDADEQLALGFKIVTNAYKTRVTSQEAEIRSLKGQLTEKLEQLSSIQKKYSNLEVQLIESTQRGNQLADENKQLITTIKKLTYHRDCTKNKYVANVFHHGKEKELLFFFHKRYYSADDMLQTTAPRTMLEINGNEDSCQTLINKIVNSDAHNIINGNFNTPYMGAGSSGEKNTDGRAFFRNARSRLTYEQFNQFLSNIKKLNNHQQKREETLKKAQVIFGETNSDLYEEFKVLISKHS